MVKLYKHMFVTSRTMMVALLCCAGLWAAPLEAAKKDKFEETIPKEFAGEDAVCLADESTIELDENFRRKLTIYRKIKILTESGKKYAEIAESFIPGIEEVNLVFARTISPDGKKIKIEEKDAGFFRSFKDFPTQSATMIFAVPMPALQVGSIVEYSIEVKSLSAKTEGMYASEFVWNAGIPILSAKNTIIFPEGIPLKYKYRKLDGDPNFEETRKNGKVTWQWTRTMIEKIPTEQLMPDYRSIVGSIMVGSSDDWKEIGAWWNKNIRTRTKLNAKTVRQVKELTKGLDSQQKKIERLYDHVANQIRYVGLDFGRDIFIPKDPNEVFEQKYGDCKDQANLLLWMLREIGIEAYPALLRTSDQGRAYKDLPRLEEFNHVIVVAYADGIPYFLDPTVERYPFGVYPYTIEGSDYLLVKGEDVLWDRVPYSLSQKNVVQTKINLEISPDRSIKGHMDIIWTGMESGLTRWILSTMQPQMKEQFVNSILNEFYSFGVVTKFEFIDEDKYLQDLRLNVQFRIDEWLVEAGEYLLLRMHDDSLVKIPDYLTKQRKFPVKDLYNRKTTVDLRVSLPENMAVHSMPEDFMLSDQGVISKITFRKDGTAILEAQSMSFDAAELYLTDVGLLKTMWERVAKAHRRQVLLEVK